MKKKTSLINFKVTADDRDRWRAALEKEGKDRTISQVCRETLERIARRVEAKDKSRVGGA